MRISQKGIRWVFLQDNIEMPDLLGTIRCDRNDPKPRGSNSHWNGINVVEALDSEPYG
jgi:hypothetical protein